MPLRKYPWKSTAHTSGAASATRTAANTIHSFLILTVLPPPGFFGQSPDRHRDERTLCETCPRSATIASLAQHLLLLSDLALVPRSLAGEDVDHVGIAIAVRAAAEAVLPFVLVHLPGQQVLLVREALIGLHEHLIAPLADVPLSKELLVHRGGDGAALGRRVLRDDDVLLDVGRLLLCLGPHAPRRLGREDDHLVPFLSGRELHVGARNPLAVAALAGLDVDDRHLDGEVGRLGHLPGVDRKSTRL